MKKKYRIKKSEEFQEIMKCKRYVRSKSFIVYAKEKKEKYARIGISVPKKNGNAVYRNRIKRQVKAMMQKMDVHNAENDIIIIVRKEYSNYNYVENQKDLENVIKHGKIRSGIFS